MLFRSYELHLTVAEGEVERLNNKAVLYVDVIDGRSKVAIVGNAPHPDLAALKQAVESNPNSEATVMLAEEVIPHCRPYPYILHHWP